jgi:hypothetical protein
MKGPAWLRYELRNKTKSRHPCESGGFFAVEIVDLDPQSTTADGRSATCSRRFVVQLCSLQAVRPLSGFAQPAL